MIYDTKHSANFERAGYIIVKLGFLTYLPLVGVETKRANLRNTDKTLGVKLA